MQRNQITCELFDASKVGLDTSLTKTADYSLPLLVCIYVCEVP